MKTNEAIKKIILEGQNNNLIKISDDSSTITYINQNISRNYNNPEEKIQAETFCELVLKYNYPVEQVQQYVKVTVGSDVKEADIIVLHVRSHILLLSVKKKRQQSKSLNRQFAKHMHMLLLLREL